MISMQVMYDELRRYGDIIADKNHETTEGHFIRFTTYHFEGKYYVATMVDGVLFMVAEKEDIQELIAENTINTISEEEVSVLINGGYNPHL